MNKESGAGSSGALAAFLAALMVLALLGYHESKSRSRMEALEHRVFMLEQKTK